MADMRRKFAMKRKFDRLEEAEDTLLRLIGALRQSENTRIAQLLNLIRSNASFEEIAVFLEQEFSRTEIERSPELRDFSSQLSRPSEDDDDDRDEGNMPRIPRRMLEVRRLADIPVYKVPAKPWTRVTDDDDLVSHLVSLWLTWTYPWFDWLDKDTFIRDMQAGDLNCQFCSPFLVNAILSEASVCSVVCTFLQIQYTKGFIDKYGSSVSLRLRRSLHRPRRYVLPWQPLLRGGPSITRGRRE
jgi:hypothetical protein